MERREGEGEGEEGGWGERVRERGIDMRDTSTGCLAHSPDQSRE